MGHSLYGLLIENSHVIRELLWSGCINTQHPSGNRVMVEPERGKITFLSSFHDNLFVTAPVKFLGECIADQWRVGAQCWYGIMGLSAVCHTLNPRLFKKDLQYIINHAGAHPE